MRLFESSFCRHFTICYVILIERGNRNPNSDTKEVKKLSDNWLEQIYEERKQELFRFLYVILGEKKNEFSDGSKTGVRIDNSAHTSVFEYRTPIEGGTAVGVVWFEGTLYKEADRIYLDLYGAPVDVTEDFADGMITGSFIYITR